MAFILVWSSIRRMLASPHLLRSLSSISCKFVLLCRLCCPLLSFYQLSIFILIPFNLLPKIKYLFFVKLFNFLNLLFFIFLMFLFKNRYFLFDSLHICFPLLSSFLELGYFILICGLIFFICFKEFVLLVN